MQRVPLAGIVKVLLQDGHVIGAEDEALATRSVHEVAARDVEGTDEALGGRVAVRHLHRADRCS